MGNIRSSKIKGLVAGDALLQDYDLNNAILSEGVLDQYESNNDLLIEQNSPLGMKIKVNKGVALVQVERDSDDKRWLLICDCNTEVVLDVNSNSTGSNRVDAVIIRISKTKIDNGSGEPDANDVSNIEVIDGTGTVALLDAEIQTEIGDDFFYRLADITVPDSSTQIQNSDIADTRSPVSIGSSGNFLIDAYLRTLFTDSIREKTTTNGVDIEGILLKDGFYEMEEISKPANPAANKLRMYPRDVGGETHWFQLDSTGVEIDITQQVLDAIIESGNVTQALVDLVCAGGDASSAHIHNSKNGVSSITITGTSDTEDIAHGLGRTPNWVEIKAVIDSSFQTPNAMNSVSIGDKINSIVSTIFFGNTDASEGQATRGVDSTNIIVLDFEDGSGVNQQITATVTLTATDIELSFLNSDTVTRPIYFTWKVG